MRRVACSDKHQTLKLNNGSRIFLPGQALPFGLPPPTTSSLKMQVIMFLLDKPYISDLLKKTVKDHGIPVINTPELSEMNLLEGTVLLNEERAIQLANQQVAPIIYTNSENSIGWIAEHLSFSNLPHKINLFKDKVKFRELIQTLFPDFYFQGVEMEQLKSIDFQQLPLPFIIKPAVGFFSMGVYKISNNDEWSSAIDSLEVEMTQVKNLYPQEVLHPGKFIIEQCIEGEEFAVDAYFDAEGTPVVLNIMRHAFSSDTDVGDRIYSTSKEIIEDNIRDFTEFLETIGQLAQLKTFAMHLELRRSSKGEILPIEVNPMRFGGWCTTSDMAYLAFGFNPYLYFFNQWKPNWDEVLAGKEGKLFSIVVLDNTTGEATKDIRSFDYEKLYSMFETPLEMRKVDFHQYPLFGFLFVETLDNNDSELEYILKSDLREFIGQ